MSEYRTNENRVLTIYDIAKEAGVSAATVSRVLTSSANVRPEKKEKVLQLIEKYNFRPNALARRLSDTRSKTIGIIAADIRNPYYAQMFVACEVAADKAGYTILLCNSFGEKEKEFEQLEKLQEQRVDAIIQFGGAIDDLVSNVKYVEQVKRLLNSIPIIITGKLDATDCHVVQIDSVKTMDLLMEHLIGLGHRDIALVGGRKDVFSTYEKIERYKQILQENQIDYREQMIGTTDSYDNESAYRKMNEMFDQGVKPTAVIAINDFSAAGIMRSILEHGYRIPEDISLVSHDNTYITELLQPKLTSIDYNYERYGEVLIDTAIAAVEGKDIPKQQLVFPTLVVRESSGVVGDI